MYVYIYTLYLGSEFTITVTFTTESKKFHPFLEVEIWLKLNQKKLAESYIKYLYSFKIMTNIHK